MRLTSIAFCIAFAFCLLPQPAYSGAGGGGSTQPATSGNLAKSTRGVTNKLIAKVGNVLTKIPRICFGNCVSAGANALKKSQSFSPENQIKQHESRPAPKGSAQQRQNDRIKAQIRKARGLD